MRRISAVLILLAFLLAGCAGSAELLPHSLYYLDGSEGQHQVWRLETDGLTKVQVTHEEGDVGEYAVSPADGSLAFVSENRLFLVDARGENRLLIADGSQVDEATEDYVFRGFVGNPVFSPDGQTLAYAFDGLHLYHLASSEDKHVLTNLGNLLGETFVFDKEGYSPGPWSPDGRKLLIIMGYFEGSTLAVMDLEAAQPFTRLRSDGPVCCQYSWTADGRSVLVANPSYSTTLPGLWRYDVDTGEETVIVPGIAEDGSINFVGWPRQLPSGELLFFHVNLERFSPEVGIPLRMVRSDPDGSNRSQVRPEEFHIIQALWAEDGSLALVLNRTNEGATQLVVARTDGSPLQVLLEGEQIRDLAWGP